MKDKTKNNILISFMRKAFMDYSKVSFDPFLPTSFLHMMKHNLSEEILRDMDFSGFGLENEAFDEIIQSFLFDFKKIRNRIDFELIFKDELAGKYAQKLYLNKGSDKWRQNFRKFADYMARKGGILYEEADSKEAQTVGCSFIETQQIRKSKDNKYAFVSEEITWKIKYDGKVLAGLRSKGFRYIYYLVSNQGKLFDVFSLHTLDAGSKNINSDAASENKDKEDPLPNRNKKKAHVDEIGDFELKMIYKNRIEELELKMNEAEKAGDDNIYKETESELIKIRKLYNEDFKQGKSRRFDDGTLKGRNAITKSISRAIDELEGKKPADRNPFRKKVASHFREALKPLSLYKIKYDPKEKIDWIFH